MTRPHLERMEIAGAAVPLHVATALDGADGDTTGYVRAALASVVPLPWLMHGATCNNTHSQTHTRTLTLALVCCSEIDSTLQTLKRAGVLAILRAKNPDAGAAGFCHHVMRVLLPCTNKNEPAHAIPPLFFFVCLFVFFAAIARGLELCDMGCRAIEVTLDTVCVKAIGHLPAPPWCQSSLPPPFFLILPLFDLLSSLMFPRHTQRHKQLQWYCRLSGGACFESWRLLFPHTCALVLAP